MGRSTQDILNLAIDLKYYGDYEPSNTRIHSFMCNALKVLYQDALITSAEYEKTTAEIESFIGFNTVLATWLERNNLLPDNLPIKSKDSFNYYKYIATTYGIPIYKDWDNKDMLIK